MVQQRYGALSSVRSHWMPPASAEPSVGNCPESLSPKSPFRNTGLPATNSYMDALYHPQNPFESAGVSPSNLTRMTASLTVPIAQGLDEYGGWRAGNREQFQEGRVYGTSPLRAYKSAGNLPPYAELEFMPGSPRRDSPRRDSPRTYLGPELSQLSPAIDEFSERRRGWKTIVMPKPMASGRLGLAVKDLQVLGVVDPSAASYGWNVGDQIVSLNGQTLRDQSDFDQQIAAALRSNRLYQTPLKFEIKRPMLTKGGCC